MEGGAVRFRPIQPVGAGGGGGGVNVSFRPIQSMRCRALVGFNQWTVHAVRFQPIQPVGVRMCVNKGGVGGGID